MVKRIANFVRSLIPARRKIQYVKVPELDEVDRQALDNMVSEKYDRLTKMLHNELQLTLHFKHYSRTGLRKQHEVKCRLSAPGMSFVSSAKAWKLLKAAQRVLKIVERDVKKRIKNRGPAS